jgi:hypothetical protein
MNKQVIRGNNGISTALIICSRPANNTAYIFHLPLHILVGFKKFLDLSEFVSLLACVDEIIY